MKSVTVRDILAGMTQDYPFKITLNPNNTVSLVKPTSTKPTVYPDTDFNEPVITMRDYVFGAPENIKETWYQIVKHSTFDLSKICEHVLSRLPDNGIPNHWFSESIGINRASDIYTIEDEVIDYVIRDINNPEDAMVINPNMSVNAINPSLQRLINLLNQYISEINGFEVKIPSQAARLKLMDYIGNNPYNLLNHVNLINRFFYDNNAVELKQDGETTHLYIGDTIIVSQATIDSLPTIRCILSLSEMTIYPKLNHKHRSALLLLIFLSKFNSGMELI